MELMSLFAKLTLDKQEYDKGLKEAENDAKGLKIDPPKIPKPDTDDFKSGIEEAEGVGNTFREVMTGVWNGIKDAIVVTGITSAVMAVVGAMRQGIDMAIENGDAISKGAANLKLSTKAYQEYEYALGKSGIKVKDLSRAMDGIDKIFSGDLNDKQKKYVEELRQMGFTADEAASNEEKLSSMMKALADYQGNDKGSIIDWLFGKDQKWTGFFEQTSDDIEKLKDQAEDMGMIMPEDAIQNAVEFKDATEEINNRLDAIKRSFGESVLPMLTDAAKMVTKIMVFFGGGDKSLAEKLAGGDKELEGELLTIEGTAAAAETLADKLLEMGDTSKMTAEQYAIWKGTAEELIKLVPSLGEKINTETGEITANTEEIKKNIQEWENLAKQKAIQSIKEEKYQEIVKANKDLVNATIEANNKAGEAAETRVKAYQAFSDEMESRGLGKLDMTGDVDQQISDLMDKLAEMGDAGEADAAALGAKLKAIGDANLDLAKAERAAADLQKQIDEAMADYEKWVAGLDAIYGTASSDAQAATSDAQALKDVIDSIPDYKRITLKEERLEGSFAIGSNYIPYDMPAMLHRGERVLTATENRKGEGGGGADLSHLEDRIAAAIRAGMEGVSVNSYINGRNVTDEVNRNNMRDVKGRRFAR